MSWTRILVHLVFTTKNRVPLLRTPEIRKEVFQHIKGNAAQKGVLLNCINGYDDHAHCLLALGKEQSVSQVAQLIKGESSYWINKNKVTPGKFSWQDDYWAVSVGDSQVDTLRNYIYTQEEHHKKSSFAEELQKLLEKYEGL